MARYPLTALATGRTTVKPSSLRPCWLLHCIEALGREDVHVIAQVLCIFFARLCLSVRPSADLFRF